MDNTVMTMSGRAWRLLCLMVISTPGLHPTRRGCWEKRRDAIHHDRECCHVTLKLDGLDVNEIGAAAIRVGAHPARLLRLLDPHA